MPLRGVATLLAALLILVAAATVAAEPIKLAVTEIRARRGIDPVLAKVVEDFLVDELARQEQFSVVGRGLKSPLKLADRIDEGLPSLSLESVKAELGLSDVEVCRTLGTSQKTISRLRKDPDKVLNRLISDRLYRMARMFQLAIDVLEGRDAAREWLLSPKVGLNNRVPLDLMSTEAGSREVEALLMRIEYGVVS